MGAPIWVLCLPLRNGLHGCCVEAAACTVAAAVGYRRDPGTSLSWCSWHRHSFGCKTLRIGSRKKAWYLDWFRARHGRFLEGREWILRLSNGPFLDRVPWEFRGDRTLQNLCCWHAVAGIRPATFFQQQEFKFFVRSSGLLGAAVDWNRGSLGSSGGLAGRRRGWWDTDSGDGCHWCRRAEPRFDI